MLKCIGYRFKSFHGEVNGKMVDSDKLIFSYISDDENGLVGFESHQLEIGGFGANSTNQCIDRVQRVFNVKVNFDQYGNLFSPELDVFVKKPIFISCSIGNNGKAVVNRVIIDPTYQADKSNK